jgi:hypothetical protein
MIGMSMDTVKKRHRQAGYVPPKEEMGSLFLITCSVILLALYLALPFHSLMFLYPSLFLLLIFLILKLKSFYSSEGHISDIQPGPFLSTIAMGQIDRVKEALHRQPMLIESRDANGQTPLHYAAVRADIAMINLLLTHGANIMAKDNEGRTALKLVIQLDERQGRDIHETVISYLRRLGSLD